MTLGFFFFWLCLLFIHFIKFKFNILVEVFFIQLLLHYRHTDTWLVVCCDCKPRTVNRVYFLAQFSFWVLHMYTCTGTHKGTKNFALIVGLCFLWVLSVCKFVYKFKNYLNKSYTRSPEWSVSTDHHFLIFEGDSSKTAVELWADPKASSISAFTVDLLW